MMNESLSPSQEAAPPGDDINMCDWTLQSDQYLETNRGLLMMGIGNAANFFVHANVVQMFN